MINANLIEDALQDAIDKIASDYCSHRGDCSDSLETCYCKLQIRALNHWKENCVPAKNGKPIDSIIEDYARDQENHYRGATIRESVYLSTKGAAEHFFFIGKQRGCKELSKALEESCKCEFGSRSIEGSPIPKMYVTEECPACIALRNYKET